MSKKDLTQGYDGDDETQGTTGGAPDFSDSFRLQEYNLTSVQESRSQSLTTKALDEPGEREAGESTKASDEKLEGDFTKQVKKDPVDEKGAGEIDEVEESGKKKTPRAGKLRSWWKKIWPECSDIQSTIQQEKVNDARTEPNKNPDEAYRKPDTTCVGKLDRAPKANEQLGATYASQHNVRVCGIAGNDHPGQHCEGYSGGRDDARSVNVPWGIPCRDGSVECIAQGILGRQDLKVEPPDRHVEGLIQWGVPGKESSVEGIAQGILGRQDLGKDSSVEREREGRT